MNTIGRLLLLIVFAPLCLAAAPTTQPAGNDDDPPSSLSLPDDGAALTVNLNDQLTLPGSRGTLTLAVKEVERGQASMSLASAHCQYIAPTTIRAGDELTFHLEGQDCVLRVEKVVMMTLGDDYVVLTLLEQSAAQHQRVDRDLSRVEQSDLVFFLDQRECTGGEMARYLREQVATIGKEPAAAAQPVTCFVNLLNGQNPIPATMPATATTEPVDPPPPTVLPAHCRVRTHDGRVVDLSSWLGHP